MITLQGKQYVLLAGLLDKAHRQGLRSIDTELLQLPEEGNGHVAIAKARIEMEDGRAFAGIGDASPTNVSSQVGPHIIRMAETRAKARALRDAVNVGVTAFEELSNGDEGLLMQHAPLEDTSKIEAERSETEPTTHAQRSKDTERSSQRAHKSQIDLLKMLAQELRGKNGVERLENRIGKPLSELSRAEAGEWINRLSPDEEGG